MKTFFSQPLSSRLVAAVCLAATFCWSASAQILYPTPASPSLRTGHTGSVGGTIKTGDNGALVTHLGFYDADGDGLATDHRVAIFKRSDETLIASNTVSAGTGGYLTNGFRYAALDQPILLEPNTSYKLQAEVWDGGDQWISQFIPDPWNSYFVGTNSSDTRFTGWALEWPAVIYDSSDYGEIYGAPNMAALPFGPAVAFMQIPNTVTQYETLSVTLTSFVNGAEPLSVQWYKSPGTLLTDKTNATLTFSSLDMTNAGDYYVIASNAGGSATSSVVSLTVVSAVLPSITTPPASRSVYVGGTASFTVGVTGTEPFTYQWKHDGTNLPGATDVTLVVPNCTAADAGDYSVGVTNVLGGQLSSTATLTLMTPAAGSYEEMIVTNGPLAYWRLNESSGTTAFDHMGGHDGTLTGGVTPGATGLAPSAFPGMDSGNTGFTFDGSSGAVVVGNPAALNVTGQITLMAWIKPSATDGYRNILMHGYQSGPWAELGLRVNDGTYQMDDWDDIGDYGVATTVPDGDVGNWVFLATTYDGTAWRLYRNGNEVASRTTTNGAIALNNVGWAIGARGDGSERYFSGDIDEAAIFDKGLSATEIAKIYAAAAYGSTTAPFVTASPSDAIAVEGTTATLSGAFAGSFPFTYQWKKDGVNIPGATNTTLTLPDVYFTDMGDYVLWATNGAGYAHSDTAALTVMAPPTFANLTNDLVLHLSFDGDYSDSSGSGYDALPFASAPSFVTGEIGQGVHIASDTSGNNVLYINGSIAFDETTSWSISFWLSYTNAFNDVPIIGNAVNSTWQPGWVLTDSAAAGQIEWSLATVTGSTYLRDPVPGCPTINDGQWHNVVCVVDRTNSLASVYVDGALASSWSIVGLGSLDGTYQYVTIGSDPNGDYGSATFDMDDLGIWNRALTSYDAASIFAAGQDSAQSFDKYGPVKVSVKAVGVNVGVSWQAGTLLWSTNVSGPYEAVPGATAPFYSVAPGEASKFFRVLQ